MQADRLNAASPTLEDRLGRDDQLALALPPASGDLAAAEQITFGALWRRVAQFQAGIARAGLREGDRVVMLFPLCADFYALALALMASGQVLVFLDGRLDRARLLRVLSAARPRAIVSVRQLLRLWPLLPPLWRPLRFVADGVALGTRPLSSLLGDGDGAPRVVPQPPERTALLSFTSGTTGRPKGADRTHGILLAQHHALSEHAPNRAGEVDMPCFPAAVLHNLACGVTSVLPPMDLRYPGQADPARVLAAMHHFGVSSMSGAPAYLRLLGEHILARGHRAPPLRRLYVGGAPVSRGLAALLLRALPAMEAEAIYGSTEAEPMASVTLEELAQAQGDGYLIGREARAAELCLVDLPEPPPALGADGLAPHLVPAGESGEVLVRGAHVIRRYLGDEEANRRYKVPAPDGSLWHRTGDLARRDGSSRLWLSGRLPDRVTHRGRVLLPFVLEAAVLEQVPAIADAALVAHEGAPEGELVLCLRPGEPGAASDQALSAARAVLSGRELPDLPVALIDAMPVDARHNSKIDRPALRARRAAEVKAA